MPESYLAALKSKCSASEQKLFDNPLFVNALNATHQLNQGSSATAAGIRYTDANTAHTLSSTQIVERAAKFNEKLVGKQIEEKKFDIA